MGASIPGADMNASFFVGDAAGRPGDFAASDKYVTLCLLMCIISMKQELDIISDNL